MLKQIVAGTLLLATLAACKSKSAFNFSQDIVKKENSLVDDITKTEEAVAKFITDENYDSIAIAGERMEKLVDIKLEEIKTMKAPNVKESENFKKAAINYFSFLKSLYTNYKKFGKAETDEARDKVALEMDDIEKRKEDAINDMQRAQKKYADANGFRIEN